MTSNDIEKLQIVATTKDGEYLLTITQNHAVINLIASLCEFHKLDKELFEEYSLTELTIGGEK